MNVTSKIQPSDPQKQNLEIKTAEEKQREDAAIALKNLESKQQQESSNVKHPTLKERGIKVWNTVCSLFAKAADKLSFFKHSFERMFSKKVPPPPTKESLKIDKMSAKQVADSSTSEDLNKTPQAPIEQPKVQTKSEDPNKPLETAKPIEQPPVKVYYPPESDLPLKDLVGYLMSQNSTLTTLLNKVGKVGFLNKLGLPTIDEDKHVEALIKFVEYNTSFLAKTALDGLEGKIKLKIDALKQKGGDWKTAEVMANSAEKLLKVARDAINECCGLDAKSLKTDIEHPELKLGEKRDLGKAFKTIATLLATLNKEYPDLIEKTFVPALTKLLFDRDFMMKNYFGNDAIAYQALEKVLTGVGVDKIVNKLVSKHILGAEETPSMQDLSENESKKGLDENEDYILVTKGASKYDLSGKTFEEVEKEGEFSTQLVKAFYDDIVKPVDDLQKLKVENLVDKPPSFPNLKKVFNEKAGVTYKNEFDSILKDFKEKLPVALSEDGNKVIDDYNKDLLKPSKSPQNIDTNAKKPEEPSLLSNVYEETKNILSNIDPGIANKIVGGQAAKVIQIVGNKFGVEEKANQEITEGFYKDIVPAGEKVIIGIEKIKSGDISGGVLKMASGVARIASAGEKASLQVAGEVAKNVMSGVKEIGITAGKVAVGVVQDVGSQAIEIGGIVGAGIVKDVKKAGENITEGVKNLGENVANIVNIGPNLEDMPMTNLLGESSPAQIQQEAKEKKIAEEQNVATEKKIKTDAKIQTLVDLSKSIQEKIKNIGKETKPENIVEISGNIWTLKNQLEAVAEDKNNPVAQDPDVKKLLNEALSDNKFGLDNAVSDSNNELVKHFYTKIVNLEQNFTQKVEETKDLIALAAKEITAEKLPESFEKNFSEAINAKIASQTDNAAQFKMIKDPGYVLTAEYPIDQSFYDALRGGQVSITDNVTDKTITGDISFQPEQASNESQLNKFVIDLHSNLGGHTDCLKLFTQVANPNGIQMFIDQLHLDQQGITVGKNFKEPLEIAIKSIGKDANGVETLTFDVKALFPIEKVVGDTGKGPQINPVESFVNTQFTCTISAEMIKGYLSNTYSFKPVISSPIIHEMKLIPVKVA